MPRKDFHRDLQEASLPGTHSQLENIKPGEDDGAISFTYTPESVSSRPIDVQALVSDLSSYPKHHDYFVYTTSDNVPSAVTASLERIGSILQGLNVSDLLVQISETIRQALSSDPGDNMSAYDPDSDLEMEDEFGFSDDDDEHDWSAGSTRYDRFRAGSPNDTSITPEDDFDSRTKISEDLRQAKMAGFKVGYLGGVNEQIIICISCRIAKLGISEEAMQAWGINRRQYLVFLIRYPNKYRDLSQILRSDGSGGKLNVEMQVALCDSYKPSYGAAMNAFLNLPPSRLSGLDAEPAKPASSAKELKARKLLRSFISKPLNALMNERFVKIVNYRFSHGFGWSQAELFYNDIQGKFINSANPADSRYMSIAREESPTTALPNLVTTDHILLDSTPEKSSFPLIGMQFVLRHFVRCTEFCLVCHCKIDAAFEALKPYVCSKSLCLYQYMALGFGPSLEWEVLSQPYVVDLLVSFTYSSAKGRRLKDFPTGLGFLVPPGSECVSDSYGYGPSPNTAPKGSDPILDVYSGQLDHAKMELIFPDPNSRPLRTGDWIVIIRHMNESGHLHCRVKETSAWPTVQLADPIIRAQASFANINQNRQIPPGHQDVKFVIYNQNFDVLSDNEKCSMIVMLLDTLPGVTQMKAFLEEKHHGAEPSLATWRNSISKSALDVLRWIVASNRSCIIQDDQAIPDSLISNNSTSHSEPRVSGMEGYIQFRFAQGAPDKEQRFIDAVTAATTRLSLRFPTLFAWHGSSLVNWHGILREGLHFKDVLHGRAFGNGVYMSTFFGVSSSYMGGSSGAGHTWPASKLRISSAISLNEVVNSPSEFVSTNPHFVVSQLDWIQPRYLFVRCDSLPNPQPRSDNPPAFYEQDPLHTAKGPNGQSIAIPITAVSQNRRPQPQPSVEPPAEPAKKKSKPFGETKQEEPLPPLPPPALPANDEEDSDETDTEDLVILTTPVSDGEELGNVDKKKSAENPKTDFVPGTLSSSSLPLLAPPSYATTIATKALQHDLKTTLNIQETQPLHELGWYVDPNLINTVYQWIVELHSFDPSLPLAQDLKAAGLTSVVMELRFSKDYPISPPFVRIIRPRFLSFMYGGGGHVTAGGALCMELLTNNGWSAVSSIESVLLQVRMAISSTEPKPARLETTKCGQVREYGVGEAVQAFRRACLTHGWEVPKEFDQMGGLRLAASGSESQQ